MTNPILKNKVSTNSAILWQYDKAYNLINLITNWNRFGTVSCEHFWNYFGNSIFPINRADEFGLNVWGNLLGIPRPSLSLLSPWSNLDAVTPEGVPFSQTTVHLSDDFYRRILKARYFMMCHSPTVPNYNKFLTILFGAIDKATNEIEYDESKIFDIEGNVKQNAYSSRSIALDFQDMSMGFSFPSDATDEEAQTIFQHYETLYPFPAGIRYPGEFIDDELVIGLNLTNGDSPTGQNYKNFVDGLVLAEDASSETANPNGGILSTTDRANYYTSPLVAGTAYICSVSSSTANVSIIATNTSTKEQKIWIDWGNGDCNYYYLPPSSTKTISPLQKQGYGFSGLVAIKVFYISEYISVAAPSATGLEVVNTYDIGTSES